MFETFAALSTISMIVIFVVTALTYFPALTLGPVLEHLLLTAGRTF